MGSPQARLAELTRICAEQRGTIEALTAAAEQREVRARDELRQATRESSQLALVARHMDSAVVGKGTGQGLSLAYASIVQKHGGSVLVDSTPGVGTTFTIVLPTGPKVPDTPTLVPAAATALDLG